MCPVSPNNTNLLCDEIFSVTTEEEQQDFNDRDTWIAEVNAWTEENEEIYNRTLILEFVNFVPDWAFEKIYLAYKWEDPNNDNQYMCQECFVRQHTGVADVWREEGLVDPFDFIEIYEDESLWCAYCDKALFKFLDKN